MAVEVATLQFKADTTDLKTAEVRLKRLSQAANAAEHNLDDVSDEMEKGSSKARGFGKAVVGAAAALGAMSGALKALEIAREFDVINASLITMTGSSEAAARAFTQIQQFAATTPFDLQQVSQAFVKLKALGLDPSEEALTSYGNTASAMGKSLDQFIEAVADASTMEFERLKEFGIKARQESDTVSLTFRGTTTTIGKSSDEIQSYLLAIGQTEFAGAMAERAATLDGAFSNLGDTVDQFFLSLTRGETGGLINQLTRSFTASIQDLTDAINLMNGTASLDLKLEDAIEEGRNLQAQVESMGPVLSKAFGLDDRLAENLARQTELINQIHEERRKQEEDAEADARQRRESAEAEAERKRLEAEKEAAEKRAEIEAKEAERKRQNAEREAARLLDEVMSMNDTEIQALERAEAEKLTLLNQFKAEGIINEQEYQAALTEILRNAQAERRELRLQDLADLHAENDELMQSIIDNDNKKKEQAQQTTTQLLAFEDVLLKGKSEKEKAAYRMAVNLANAEKRENARKIVSDSYTAAMGAYKSLAGIPIIGPALGAAAAATILAAGVSYAAQSLQGRALGGQVRAGESYVVGERGPEILTMGSSGNITPNSAIGPSAGGVVNKTANVNFNITANDSEGFDNLLNSRRGLLMSIINDALNDSGRVALV